MQWHEEIRISSDGSLDVLNKLIIKKDFSKCLGIYARLAKGENKTHGTFCRANLCWNWWNCEPIPYISVIWFNDSSRKSNYWDESLNQITEMYGIIWFNDSSRKSYSDMTSISWCMRNPMKPTVNPIMPIMTQRSQSNREGCCFNQFWKTPIEVVQLNLDKEELGRVSVWP